MYANTSDDSDIFIEQLNNVTVEVQEEIETKANKIELDFDDEIIEEESFEEVDIETGEITDDVLEMEF